MWYWTESYSLAVAFATWVLQRDGLRVPPFEAHRGGDGRLRSIGLDQPKWLAWIGRIVEAEGQLTTAMSTTDLRKIAPEQRREISQMEMRRDPAACWVGGSEIRRSLEGLWREFQPIGEVWARSMTSTKRHARISAGQERSLWRQLTPVRDRLPTFRVYPVDYVQLVALPIPPTSCVVGIGPPDPEGRAYVELVTAARL